ncbi:MAG: molybdopterin-binding oxidoreductase, partial [Chloroflexota bacterium]|nr:molybdopterin-binding oxidoreductase [Chloroflexota bacterium]
MKLKSVGFGALAGLMLTAPLVAIMYLANKWFELSFPPFDAFDWVARILPGPMVTFGIDLMVDSLMLIGMSVKDFAKTAEQIMAIGIFLGAGVVATIVIFGLVERRIASGWRYLGVACGAIIGVPIAIITASIGQSPLEPTTNFVWT